MSRLSVTGRVALPEPLSYHTFFRRDGRRGVAVGEPSGQLWLLDADPATRTCGVRPLPIRAERRADGEGGDVRELSGSHTLDRLLLWSGRACVYDIPSGHAVADLERIPGRALCLSPDGRWVLCLDEESGAMMDLAAPDPSWRETNAFHVRRREDGEWEAVYLDHVDNVAALPAEEEPRPDDDFWIAAGCYGLVATHLVDVDPVRREVYPVPGDAREFGDLVYDPTEVLRQPGQRHVFVRHGYGTGLAALDPATGEFHHCWIRGRARQPYGFIGGVVPCGTAPIAWGHSKDGHFLWRVGEPPVMMPDPPGTVIAMYPHAMLCVSHDGGELLWCDLPAS